MPRWLRKELIILGVFAAIGLLALPPAIYLVGLNIFGGYADGTLADFLRRFFASALAGDVSTLFLIAAPYLVWQCLRVAWAGLRAGPTKPANSQ